jgi:hypothetical protein
LSPDLIARIARLEEIVAAGRLPGGFVTPPGTYPHVSPMAHIADMGSPMGSPGEGASGGAAATGRTTGVTAKPADIGRTTDIGRTSETIRPADPARPAMTTGRPTEANRSAEIVRPLEAGRALERGRTMETRDPNGSPRRRTGETQHEVDFSVYRDAETHRNGTSYGWLWALPLAALAGLGLYYLAGDRGERTVTASREAVQPARDTAATAPDLKGPTLNAIQSLTTAMQGVRDATSATAAMPKLQEASREMERLAMQASQLPTYTRAALADATHDQMARLNTLIDSASGLPGVGPQLQQAVSTLRGRMDAIAMAPGKPLFLTGAPGEWLLISSLKGHDVLNRAGERLGTAEGFFIGRDGKIVASLVSADRQLGIGDRQIGLSFTGGQLERRGDGWHLVVDTSKDDLQRAKSFETGK